MNIKNGYFVNSIENTQQSIEERTGRKAAQIPILLDSPNKRYYITDSGDVFFCKVIANKCFIIPKHHDKRKLSEKFVRLSIGAKKEIHVTVAQCMYNAFKAHRWLDLRPKYKNGNNDDYYVCTCSDAPIEPRTFRNYYKAYILEKVKLDHCIKFHGLRHTFATTLIENKVDIKTTSSILGHSDVSTTLNIYVHPSDEAKRDAMNVGLKKIFR